MDSSVRCSDVSCFRCPMISTYGAMCKPLGFCAAAKTGVNQRVLPASGGTLRNVNLRSAARAAH